MDVCLVWVLCVVFASGWSLVQRSPTECDVSEYDREASTKRRPLLTRSCCTLEKKKDWVVSWKGSGRKWLSQSQGLSLTSPGKKTCIRVAGLCMKIWTNDIQIQGRSTNYTLADFQLLQLSLCRRLETYCGHWNIDLWLTIWVQCFNEDGCSKVSNKI
jgi:hypothetical protein